MLRDTFFTQTEPEAETAGFELPIDLIRVDDKLVLRAPIVGVDLSHINVSLGPNRLTIHKTETPPTNIPSSDHTYIQECHWGELDRVIDLPLTVNPDTTRATLHDGVLTIVMPIVSPDQSKIIHIKS